MCNGGKFSFGLSCVRTATATSPVIEAHFVFNLLVYYINNSCIVFPVCRALSAVGPCVRVFTKYEWDALSQLCTKCGLREQRLRAYTDWLWPKEYLPQHEFHNFGRVRAHEHTPVTCHCDGLVLFASLNLKSFEKHIRIVHYTSWSIRQVWLQCALCWWWVCLAKNISQTTTFPAS